MSYKVRKEPIKISEKVMKVPEGIRYNIEVKLYSQSQLDSERRKKLLEEIKAQE